MATAKGVRARVRAELTAAIKNEATQQLATDGATGLNLRAIARNLDMASSAIYRYFPSRNELLTALIIDAYDAIGQAVEKADADCKRSDHHGRLVATAVAIRTWAQDNPNEYALIYGSPVPGYEAPEDTIDPAVRVPLVLLTNFVEHQATGGDTFAVSTMPEPPAALAEAIAGLTANTGGLLPTAAVAAAIDAWGQIFGLVSLELFGHLNSSVEPDDRFFRYSMDQLAQRAFVTAD